MFENNGSKIFERLGDGRYKLQAVIRYDKASAGRGNGLLGQVLLTAVAGETGW